MFYYVYILRSDKDKMIYTGYTKDLKLRFKQHEDKLVTSIKERGKMRSFFKTESYLTG